MNTPDPVWQRDTALLNIEQYRNKLLYTGRPFNDRMLAEYGAKLVGAKVDTVLKWMSCVMTQGYKIYDKSEAEYILWQPTKNQFTPKAEIWLLDIGDAWIAECSASLPISGFGGPLSDHKTYSTRSEALEAMIERLIRHCSGCAHKMNEACAAWAKLLVLNGSQGSLFAADGL